MQPTTMLPKLTDTTQTISFSEDDDTCGAEVFATDVVVTTNIGNHNHGSSKVKLTNLVDYNWEAKFYPGRLIDVHNSGKYLAYCIKAPNSVDGMVRVVYMDSTNNERSLIKGMKGEVQDLAFAFIQNQVLLACIDEMGNIYVHEIELIDGRLRCTLIVEIQEDTGMGGTAHLLAWCPYIPDEDDDSIDDDVAKMLLTTHSNVARMWSVRAAAALCAGGAGGCGAVSASAALARGAGRAAGAHAAPLRAAAFSPDGTALATAADDGYVMFAQVYINSSNSPRCLHKWQPHDGKPLTCLFFLDNHKNYNADVQFWKFAVTGADNNTTIKIWSCKSWSCLQTLTFAAPLGAEPALAMKAQLDVSANYLLLSDFRARSLYVLNMARDHEDAAAYCRSISEFLLPYQVLGFCIVDAEEQPVKCESRCEDPYHRNGSAADDSPTHFDLHDTDVAGGGARSRLRLFVVQPKSLQEADLLYTRPAAPAAHDLSALDVTVEDEMPANILQQQTQQLKNLLLRAQPQPNALVINPRMESPTSIPQLNLMTPDAFSSPGKHDGEEVVAITAPENGDLLTAECSEEAAASEGSAKPASGGSSPSREVQQIMSHNDYYKEEDDEEEESQQSPAAEGFAGDLYPAPDHPPAAVPNSDVTWPQISLAQITEANQRKASSDKSSNKSANQSLPASLPATLPTSLPAPLPTSLPTSLPAPLPASLPAPLPAPLPASLPAPLPASLPAPPTAHSTAPLPNAITAPLVTTAVDDITRNKLEALEQKIDKLTELVSSQAAEARAARGEARAARDALEHALHHQLTRAAHALDAAVTERLERMSRSEEAAGLKASRALEQLAGALQRDFSAKLAAADQQLRTNIDSLASSKTLADRIGSTVGGAVAGAVGEAVRGAVREAARDHVRAAVRDALLDGTVPLLEKAHAQIFRQVNQAFQAGTKEFAAHTEAVARAAAERGGAAAAGGLRAALDQHAEAIARAAPLHPQQFAATLREVVHGVLEKEMCWWREQALASRAHSPATPSVAHTDRQKVSRNVPRNCVQESLPYLLRMQVNQIQSMIMNGDVNGAFQLALSAADLRLVVGACRGAEPARVFGPPCRLRQHVLLSLVQQLAADMARDTHLKHRYLEEAIMNLDTTNPLTREHLPNVIRELQKQIMAFLQANPGHCLTRQFRMLLMATESLIKGTA